MKEATDATLGAEHPGSPAGMLLFQRSNPRGGENRLALLSSTLPHSRWARPSPVPLPGLVGPLAPPEPAFRFPVPRPRQLCCSRRRSPGEGGWVGWSSGPGNRVAAVRGRCGPPGSQICPQP